MFEVMIKTITNCHIIFFIFQQLRSQLYQIYQNGIDPFCDETLNPNKTVLFWRLFWMTPLEISDGVFGKIQIFSYTITKLKF